MQAGSAATIGKAELADRLGWARTRLDRRLKSDPNFPVVSRGDQSGGWSFDENAVRAHLDGVPAPPALDKAQLRDAVAPPVAKVQAEPVARRARRSADHTGEATARQRKDEADASLKEDKLREQRGELVERGHLRQALAQVMASFAHDLDALPERIVKVLELPEDAAPGIRTMIDQIRVEMVKRAEPLLADV